MVDARMVGPVGHGIARYVEHLAKGLELVNEDSRLSYDPVFLTRPGRRIRSFETIETEIPFLSMRELREIPALLRSAGADLYHSPSFSSLWSAPCPWLVTIHDLIHLHYGSFSQKMYYRVLLKRFAHRAARVMSVSEFSQNEISEWTGLSLEKIEVVYNAIEAPAISEEEGSVKILSRYRLLKGRYFLCLSNTKPHKNLSTLIQAYSKYVKQSGPMTPWPLLLSVSEGDLEGALPEGVICGGGFSDEEVEVLLANSGAVVFPSVMEGFGRPPLEALVRGVPVALSKIPAHEEALMGIARAQEVIWVRPDDARGWSGALERLSSHELPGPSELTKEKILTKYSVRGLGLHIDRIYRDVIGKRT